MLWTELRYAWCLQIVIFIQIFVRCPVFGKVFELFREAHFFSFIFLPIDDLYNTVIIKIVPASNLPIASSSANLNYEHQHYNNQLILNPWFRSRRSEIRTWKQWSRFWIQILAAVPCEKFLKPGSWLWEATSGPRMPSPVTIPALHASRIMCRPTCCEIRDLQTLLFVDLLAVLCRIFFLSRLNWLAGFAFYRAFCWPFK